VKQRGNLCVRAVHRQFHENFRGFSLSGQIKYGSVWLEHFVVSVAGFNNNNNSNNK